MLKKVSYVAEFKFVFLNFSGWSSHQKSVYFWTDDYKNYFKEFLVPPVLVSPESFSVNGTIYMVADCEFLRVCNDFFYLWINTFFVVYFGCLDDVYVLEDCYQHASSFDFMDYVSRDGSLSFLSDEAYHHELHEVSFSHSNISFSSVYHPNEFNFMFESNSFFYNIVIYNLFIMMGGAEDSIELNKLIKISWTIFHFHHEWEYVYGKMIIFGITTHFQVYDWKLYNKVYSGNKTLLKWLSMKGFYSTSTFKEYCNLYMETSEESEMFNCHRGDLSVYKSSDSYLTDYMHNKVNVYKFFVVGLQAHYPSSWVMFLGKIFNSIKYTNAFYVSLEGKIVYTNLLNSTGILSEDMDSDSEFMFMNTNKSQGPTSTHSYHVPCSMFYPKNYKSSPKGSYGYGQSKWALEKNK